MRATCKSSSLLLALGFFVGCTEMPHVFQPGPPMQSFHSNVSGTQIRRVAVLPIAYATAEEASLAELDAVLMQELGKTTMFELVPVSRDALDTRFGRRAFSSVEVLPGEILSKLRTDYGVDGILFTELTHYRPYQPISIGVRSKLVDTSTGQIRWAFDHVFDAGNFATARAAEEYYLATTTPPPIVEHPVTGAAVLQSPSRFTQYVAWEAFRSLIKQPVYAN